MKHLYLKILMAVLIIQPSHGMDKINIVVSFSILKDLVENVGGKHVDVKSIVGADEDAHVYNPTPADGIMLANANLVFVNGLGFEGWMDRLIATSGYTGNIIIAAKGVSSIKARDNPMMAQTFESPKKANEVDDPHAWHSVLNIKNYVTNIRDALISLRPHLADHFMENATAYINKLDELNAFIHVAVKTVPISQRHIITAHDAFQYFAKEYGITFLAPQGVSTDSEPTPESVVRLMKLIHKTGIKTVFIENMTNEKHIRMLSENTKAKLGGPLYSDALAKKGVASNYIGMMRHNISLMITAMSACTS